MSRMMALLRWLVCVAALGSVVPALGAAVPECHVVYDAGSSGTRMYVYQKQEQGWREYTGPRVSALADPVRQIRGKNHADMDAVTEEIAATLAQIKQEGPVDDKGRPGWDAFDWERRCDLRSVMVYATAGMRLAEAEDRAGSARLWQLLAEKLQAKAGDVPVLTRTLTGYEEGLFAWLAVGVGRDDLDFGIVEMGGASSQIAFPCPRCDRADDAVRPVWLNGEPVAFYSYSFLGLGQDEAPKALGQPAGCRHGVGSEEPDWTLEHCTGQLRFAAREGLKDPYNVQQQRRGGHRRVPVTSSGLSNWYLTGAFKYMEESHFDTCCMNKGQCYNAETSCFRVAYLPSYLTALGVPADAPVADANWPLGAVMCRSDDCLRHAEPPLCRWAEEGCL
ncbi:hypothetical protein [Zobellella sp. DQSA1]|uniref:hypothetical protein n=1 Tax=Zobellella sp. DQSA1 TaxID=3342386 RepID=UPI0035BFE30F